MNPLRTEWQRKWIGLDRQGAGAGKIQELADAASEFCLRWIRGTPQPALLVICGNTGTGKTHTAKAIHRFCGLSARMAFDGRNWGANRVPSTFYLSWPVAANLFNEKNLSVMVDASENDLVVLDDVGAENDPWKICADKLCQILSRRENKFTVLTTNIMPEAWPEAFDVRITDRLFRNSKIIELNEVASYEPGVPPVASSKASSLTADGLR